MKYNITEIANILKAQLIGDKKREIRYISIDSRKLLQAESSLFIGISGERNNGHDYITSLYANGVRAFLVDDYREEFKSLREASFIVVKDSLKAFHIFTKHHRERFTYPLIGITGSNGKTIVKEWLYHMLMPKKKLVRSPRSYNSQVGVPLSLCLMNADYDLAIIEAGISQMGEMEKLEKMIQADIGIFTNLGLAHSENFPDELVKLREKLLLFKNTKLIISCLDDDRVNEELNKQFPKSRLLTWSTNKEADIKIQPISKDMDASRLRIIYNEIDFELNIPFGDEASVQNCINCVVCLLHMGYETTYIQERVNDLTPVAMRLEIKEGVNDCVLINDYYNSDISSIGIAIDIMERQSLGRKKTIVISDFLESGYQPERLYAELANILKIKNIDRIIGIGENISKYGDLFEAEKMFFPTTDAFVKSYTKEMFSNEVVLLRAAREFHFEQLSILLQKKAHRTVLEVDLNAIEYNYNHYKSLLKPETKITVMVKAFSYGSGLVDIAKILEYNRVDYLAVAIADEGITLRNDGISVPIIVMNPEEYSFGSMIEYDLEPEIYSFSELEAFTKALEVAGANNYPIHIKLDTGMHRMGFVESEIPDLISRLMNNEIFFIRSIFSHLAGSDESVFDDFTREQIEKFDKWSSLICKAFDHKIIRHILNSSGIDRFIDSQFDMVRLGIGLYGLSSTNAKLKNVSTLKTSISQIKHVKAGETVGYSRKSLLAIDSRIAVIPIGYADGLRRNLGNGIGKVLINGHFAPIIGNICMDMCMINISGISAKEGDTVIIFGEGYTANELAKQLGTIPYEIITSISERVKRIYVSE
jgi:alanine racemase